MLVVPVCGLLVLFIRWFCVRAVAPLHFRGGAVRFSSVLGAFFCFLCILCWVFPFGNKFLFIQKKKKKKSLPILCCALVSVPGPKMWDFLFV